MIIDVGSLAVMGATLGTLLGVAARYLAVEEDPLEAELAGMLPGSQCGQCGYVGCAQAAKALAAGEAPVTVCRPGGKAVAEQIAKRLGVSVDLSAAVDKEPAFAFVDETLCIGCTRCTGACTTDAIIGAPKQIHTIVPEICHGCEKCFNICPTEAIKMCKIPVTLGTWHWDKPQPLQ